MSYAIIYSSQTGNTRLLADTLCTCLPKEDCIYFGTPDTSALKADYLYIGFWTDKGTCDAETLSFLKNVKNKKVFLFGTAGFGGSQKYFDTLIQTVKKNLDTSNIVTGTYMCQGKMPAAVRQRYEAMLKMPDHRPDLEMMIENFDKALSHPDQNDLENLKATVLVLLDH